MCFVSDGAVSYRSYWVCRSAPYYSVCPSLICNFISFLVCIYYPCWHKGHVRINSTYRAFSAERMDALLGVRIGLKHVNITLSAVEQLSLSNETDRRRQEQHHQLHDLNYNERFYFTEGMCPMTDIIMLSFFNSVKTMERELYNALRKGLPYPILKVVEYLSVDRAGFVWGRQYRLAGYYACILLWYVWGAVSLSKLGQSHRKYLSLSVIPVNRKHYDDVLSNKHISG